MNSFSQKILGIFRNVFWPYDVFKKNDAGNIIYDYSTPERPPDPEVDLVASYTSKILSLLASLTAVDVALRELTGVGFRELFDKIF